MRNVGAFLERTLTRFIGDRAATIDRVFSLYLRLSPAVETYRADEQEPKPKRVLFSFSVVDSVAWVNLLPALDLLHKAHELLPSFFYHSLRQSMHRWFRVFDTEDAGWRWDDWMAMREEEEAYRKTECEQSGETYEPVILPAVPVLPACVQAELPELPKPALALARRGRAKALIAAVESLAEISQRSHPPVPNLSREDRDELYPDADQDVPMLALAFGEHDIVTEFLNEEIEVAGQVDREPWPTFKMDGTNPASIRDAFACADLALDTLAAAARVLLLVPGFDPLR